MSEPIELLQFRFSPYNEKVRWALDYKGIAHTRRSLAPGPHAAVTRRLTGQTATPVLKIGARAIAGSAQIIGELETLKPLPALYPTDEALRARALAIEKRFDEELMPRIRRAILMTIVHDGQYVSKVFGGGYMYGLLFPLVRGLVKKGNGITGPESAADGARAAQEAFDWVAQESKATGYLAGSSFSVADLAVASHLATCIDPPHADMQRPQPAPQKMNEWLERWRGHPGAEWVMRMYAKHRPAPLAR
ncbi:MAG: glutathione S-transferase [Alphaproteobacteria bacterium]|nr:glutathione S-transferase [Alphaproteobacteria bacterium]